MNIEIYSAEARSINIEEVVAALRDRGFTVVGAVLYDTLGNPVDEWKDGNA